MWRELVGRSGLLNRCGGPRGGKGGGGSLGVKIHVQVRHRHACNVNGNLSFNIGDGKLRF